ncbi:hypothetical protein M0811_00356 [Anaeramoeba ignava]|uniref:Uncharacterized protein n=1 Tax=Anaeramoeba ignava TaxID=1746090 RepID=A0A9Q0RDW6_ANAIG|nr:hypothetical protein M0811_00356 [Anaeramoeba ignava]
MNTINLPENPEEKLELGIQIIQSAFSSQIGQIEKERNQLLAINSQKEKQIQDLKKENQQLKMQLNDFQQKMENLFQKQNQIEHENSSLHEMVNKLRESLSKLMGFKQAIIETVEVEEGIPIPKKAYDHLLSPSKSFFTKTNQHFEQNNFQKLSESVQPNWKPQEESKQIKQKEEPKKNPFFLRKNFKDENDPNLHLNFNLKSKEPNQQENIQSIAQTEEILSQIEKNIAKKPSNFQPKLNFYEKNQNQNQDEDEQNYKKVQFQQQKEKENEEEHQKNPFLTQTPNFKRKVPSKYTPFPARFNSKPQKKGFNPEDFFQNARQTLPYNDFNKLLALFRQYSDNHIEKNALFSQASLLVGDSNKSIIDDLHKLLD